MAIDVTRGHSKDVMDDASKASGLGLSYGKYKAGEHLKESFIESGYLVQTTDHVKQKDLSDADNKPKAVAFIK